MAAGAIMDRRKFLAATSATLSYAVLPKGYAFAQPAAAKRIIDAHCHVFNAKDLPIEDFLEKVIFGDVVKKLKANNKTLANLVEKNQAIPRTLIRVIAAVVKAETPDVPAEISFLKSLPAAKFGRAEKDIKESEAALIARILNIIWEPEKYLIPKIPKRERKFLTNTVVADACRQLRFLIRNELNPQNQILSPQENWEGPEGVVEKMGDLAGRLYYTGDGPLAHTLRWAVKFTRYRIELIDGLKNIYGGETKLLLATPAQVDFEKWVYDIPHVAPPLNRPAPIEDQIDMLERLSRKAASAPSPVHIHGFVAFDPLRQVLFERLSAAEQKKQTEPLELVRRAIATQGFIGVKLYPPMGFRAIGNKDRSLPEPVTRYYKLDKSTGGKIDEALLKLYVWCRDNNVPVMAHANQSNEPYDGGNASASPDFWQNLIETSSGNKDFKSLKINLAHFGGFEETIGKWLAGDSNAGPETSWEWKIGQIREKYPDAQLFSDISYLNEVLQVPDRENLQSTLDGQDLKEQQEQAKKVLAQVKKHFTAFKNRFSKSEDFLVFGSDWLMLGEEGGYPDADSPKQSYGDLVRNFLEKDVGYGAPAVDKIMFGNAVKFLGLGSAEGEKSTRRRLETFYGGSGGEWLKEFDNIA